MHATPHMPFNTNQADMNSQNHTKITEYMYENIVINKYCLICKGKFEDPVPSCYKNKCRFIFHEQYNLVKGKKPKEVGYICATVSKRECKKHNVPYVTLRRGILVLNYKLGLDWIFNTSIYNKLHLCHINGIETDDRFSNLSVCLASGHKTKDSIIRRLGKELQQIEDGIITFPNITEKLKRYDLVRQQIRNVDFTTSSIFYNILEEVPRRIEAGEIFTMDDLKMKECA